MATYRTYLPIVDDQRHAHTAPLLSVALFLLDLIAIHEPAQGQDNYGQG
jgi:hypothetical protein